MHSSQRYNAGIKLNHFFLVFFYVSFIYACIIIIFAYLVCCKKRRVEKFKLSLTINYLKKLDEWNIHTKREPQLKNTIFFLCLAKPRIMSYQKGLTFFHFFFFCLAKPSIRSYQEGLTFFIFPFGDFLLSFDIFETKQKLRFTYNKSILGIRTYYAFPKKNHIEH